MSWFTQQNTVYADLHMHSTASDGVLAPAALAKKLNGLRVQVAALTDHDCIDGIPEFREHFNGRCISGVELSVTVKDQDIHLLGYDFDTDNKALIENLTLYRRVRTERVEKICAKLRDLGMPLQPAEILSGRTEDDGALGRPHIARVLLEKGYVKSMQEAFSRYLSTNGPAYVPKHRMSLSEGVQLIRQAGGVAVLAHPGLYWNETLIQHVMEEKLDGVELYHPNHDSKMRDSIHTQFAQHVGFFSGGSDFHGSWDGRDSLAQYGLDFDQWLNLKKALQ